jgi:hypothetical protein
VWKAEPANTGLETLESPFALVREAKAFHIEPRLAAESTCHSDSSPNLFFFNAHKFEKRLYIICLSVLSVCRYVVCSEDPATTRLTLTPLTKFQGSKKRKTKSQSSRTLQSTLVLKASTHRSEVASMLYRRT